MKVVIPARDEEDQIVKCLQALASQSDLTTFDVTILANNCTDRTVERAREFGRTSKLQLQILEATLPAHHAHVGTARKMLMDRAATGFIAAGCPHGVVATTDADTIVASDWVEQTLYELRGADAVAGFVDVSQADQSAMLPPVRALYARESAYRSAWTALESLIDPQSEDPPPRHGAFVAASLAVTASMYDRAGGIPPLPCLEDREFLSALRRVDARIRFSPRVRAWTSGRRIPRVAGGFGTFMRHLHEQGANGQPLLVEHPRKILDELEGRAALRRIWRGEAAAHDLALVCALFAIDRPALMKLLDRSEPFGANYERIVASAGCKRGAHELVPVDEAIAELRAAAVARQVVAGMRDSAASSAG